MHTTIGRPTLGHLPQRRRRLHPPIRFNFGDALSRQGVHFDDDDDDDVYYPKGRKPREDEKGEESYEKQRQRPGGRGLDARSCASTEGCGYPVGNVFLR